MPTPAAQQPPLLPEIAELIPKRVARAVGTLVVHCSASPSGKWLGGRQPWQVGYRTAPTVIDQWHLQRGFLRQAAALARFNADLPSIGYHFVVDLDGRVFTGRHLDETGAHVAGHNARSVGICLVGGAERTARYQLAQWRSLALLVQALLQRFAHASVVGHRDLSPDADGDGKVESHEWLKTCPGFNVSAWLLGGMKPLKGHLLT
jgi:hypothetical protein